MARVIVFGADLGDIVAATELRPGIRWGEASDAHALSAAGLNKAFTDWLIQADAARFVVAAVDDRIVGHIIYEATEEVGQFDWLLIKLHAGRDVFSYGSFVVPEYRNQGLLGAMRGYAARHFAEKGYSRNLSAVHTDNIASIRANARIGAKSLLTLTRIRLGRLVLVWQGAALRHVSLDPNRPYKLSL